jgi:hypothetical protein
MPIFTWERKKTGVWELQKNCIYMEINLHSIQGQIYLWDSKQRSNLRNPRYDAV